MNTIPTGADVVGAALRLHNVVRRTPLQFNDRLSEATGLNVWLKREDLQPVRSYKLRGAYNLMAQLPEERRSAGVVCASAGNHGQGVAYACRHLGIDGAVVVPATTPRQKRDRIRALGGERVEVVVTGDTYDEAKAASERIAAERGATLVPAFDDPRTIAGQGTIAPEIVEDLGRAPDAVIAPVGGGGLIGGLIAWLGQFSPSTRVIGVEPAGAASAAAALAAGGPVDLPHLDTFVDGAAVRRMGELPYAIVRDAGADFVSVDEGAVCTEMLNLYQVEGIIAEPAGALTPTALATGLIGSSAAPGEDHAISLPQGATVVAVLSGGNNDVSRYSEIVERSLVHEGRKHYFLVSFPQEPGALRRFLDGVLGPDDDIALFEYTKKSNRELGPALVGLELGDPADLPGLLDRIATSPLTVEPIDPTGPFYRFLV